MIDLKIITTVLLLPMCECSPISRNSTTNFPKAFTLYNSTNKWWLNPDEWQAKKVLRYGSYDNNVVLFNYDIGMTALAVAQAIAEQQKFPQLNPLLAYHHTSVYRWTLRFLSLYPDIFYNKILEMHKVWRRRFYYENYLVPDWLRSALIWVDPTSWDKEDDMFYQFRAFPKRIFDKYDRYPPATFVSKESWSKDTSIFYPGPFEDYDKVNWRR